MRKRRCKGESKQTLQMSAWLLASIRMMALCSHTVAIRIGTIFAKRLFRWSGIRVFIATCIDKKHFRFICGLERMKDSMWIPVSHFPLFIIRPHFRMAHLMRRPRFSTWVRYSQSQQPRTPNATLGSLSAPFLKAVCLPAPGVLFILERLIFSLSESKKGSDRSAKYEATIGLK